MLTPFNNPQIAHDLSVTFLRLILPEQGYYIAAIKLVKRKGFRPSIFASTIDELWAAIENADRDGYENLSCVREFQGTLQRPSREHRTVKSNSVAQNATP